MTIDARTFGVLISSCHTTWQLSSKPKHELVSRDAFPYLGLGSPRPQVYRPTLKTKIYHAKILRH